MTMVLARLGVLVVVLLGAAHGASAHSGPPYPIVSDLQAGAYVLSVWTDPDATDDGSPEGQFWVVFETPAGTPVPPTGTRVSVAIQALDRPAAEVVAAAEPVDGLMTRHFARLLMDHEGRFAVRVTVEGPLGRAEVTSEVEATYDLRPPPILMAVYLLPFVALGALWVKLLARRRRAKATVAPADRPSPDGA